MTSLTQHFTTASFFLVGIVNSLPVIGVLSSARITTLYGVDVATDDMALLLRHRAVMFFIVGALLVIAAFVNSLRLVSGVAGLLSMMSFVLIAWSLADINPSLQRIVMIDIVASVILLAALMLDQRTGS